MVITLDNKFSATDGSLLVVSIQGTPQQIRDQLARVVKEFDDNGKPSQGITECMSGEIRQVFTPVWKGKRY
jgi:hypothetical protein